MPNELCQERFLPSVILDFRFWKRMPAFPRCFFCDFSFSSLLFNDDDSIFSRRLISSSKPIYFWVSFTQKTSKITDGCSAFSSVQYSRKVFVPTETKHQWINFENTIPVFPYRRWFAPTREKFCKALYILHTLANR